MKKEEKKTASPETSAPPSKSEQGEHPENIDSRATNSPETLKPNFPSNQPSKEREKSSSTGAPVETVVNESSEAGAASEPADFEKRGAENKGFENLPSEKTGAHTKTADSNDQKKNDANLSANRGSTAKSDNKDKQRNITEEHDHLALHKLFVNELKDIYWAEQHLVNKLPRMAEKADSAELRDALEKHLQETENHVSRLEKVFKSINEQPKGKMCEAMNGLTSEAQRTIDETEPNTHTRDVAIIACAQKVEHYEIATYGTLRSLASIMHHTEAEKLLAETLEEEKSADKTLTEIAEDFVNEHALDEMR